MIEAARSNVADPLARFEVCSFEDFADGPQFGLIVSATAFPWVDPAIGLAKAARLLYRGGWLALLTTEERATSPDRARNPGSRAHPRHVPELQRAGPGRLYRRPQRTSGGRRRGRPDRGGAPGHGAGNDLTAARDPVRNREAARASSRLAFLQMARRVASPER
jgi:hypothetical protein